MRIALLLLALGCSPDAVDPTPASEGPVWVDATDESLSPYTACEDPITDPEQVWFELKRGWTGYGVFSEAYRWVDEDCVTDCGGLKCSEAYCITEDGVDVSFRGEMVRMEDGGTMETWDLRLDFPPGFDLEEVELHVVRVAKVRVTADIHGHWIGELHPRLPRDGVLQSYEEGSSQDDCSRTGTHTTVINGCETRYIDAEQNCNQLEYLQRDGQWLAWMNGSDLWLDGECIGEVVERREEYERLGPCKYPDMVPPPL